MCLFLAVVAGQVLPVRQYYVQTDSAVPGQTHRMCFSSTCALAIKYLRPGALLGVNADDTYLRTVQRFGDTTSPTTQISARVHYGVQARFATHGRRQVLQREIEAGFPVGSGFLHHGPSHAPR